jgi:hypothetical protein
MNKLITEKKYYTRPNILIIFFMSKNKVYLYKKNRWIRIISWKIKHKQTILKNFIFKKGMQS